MDEDYHDRIDEAGKEDDENGENMNDDDGKMTKQINSF